MNSQRSFGQWLRQSRRALDLTQEELAQRVGCSAITLRKLEAEQRRPSKQIAERLADVLQVPPDERPAFLRFARGDPFAGPGDTPSHAGTESQSRARRNLPLQLTSFIGREKEMTEVQRLLATDRIVSLIGAGGSGKTRLALEVAGGLEREFADGAWLVELAPLADPALVAHSVAAALGLREAPGRAVIDALVDYLRPKALLLVMDDCEHLIQSCAELAERLLRGCPQLTVLATSREALSIPGERVFLVPTLSVPDARAAQSVEVLAGYDAVRLFVDRAQSALPDFALTTANAPAVALVCRQLDGIPLAIELAAARMRMLAIDEIAAGLDDRFQLLRRGSRTALPRHQTLQALVDWSYNLLTEPERELLQRLAVFAGGWTLEAARVVGASEGVDAVAVLDSLGQLVAKSLVISEHDDGSDTRYRMLETIRQYALARLEASGEADGVRRRQTIYYLQRAHALYDYGRPFTMAREVANLREVLTWSRSTQMGSELHLQLLGALDYYWYFSGYWTEGRAWLEGALAQLGATAHPEAQASMLRGLGYLLTCQGEYAASEASLAHSRELFRSLGDTRQSTQVLRLMGILARERDDAALARLRLEESLAAFRELGDRSEVAEALNPLGEVLMMQGDALGASKVLEESLALSRELENPNTTGWALNHLGHVAQLQGNWEWAKRLHEESLIHFRKFGELYLGQACAYHGLAEIALAQNDAALAADHFTNALRRFQDLADRAGTAWCLGGLAGVTMLDEEPERAARLWGAAESFRQCIGVRDAPASQATRERLMAAAKKILGEEAFDAVWAEGARMTVEQAIELAV